MRTPPRRPARRHPRQPQGRRARRARPSVDRRVQGRASSPPTRRAAAADPTAHRRRRGRRGPQPTRPWRRSRSRWLVVRSASFEDASAASRRRRRSRAPWSSSRRRASSRPRQRVHAAVPYSEQITEVVKDLAAAGGVVRHRRCSPAATRSSTRRYVVITADRGLCGGYNSGVQRAAEGEVKADVARRRGLRDRRRSAGRPRATSASAATRSARRSAGSRRQPDATRTPARSASTSSSCSWRARSTGSSSSTPASSRPARQEVVLRPLVPLERDTVAGGDGKAGDGDGAGRRLRVRARSRRRSSTRCCPRYVEARVYAALLNAAASRARLPPAGDEGGHRQRRRTDQDRSAAS